VTVRKALDADLWITAGLSTGCEFEMTMRLPASKRWVVTDYPPGLTRLLRERDQVLDALSGLDYMSRSALRWQLSSGRWQQPCRGVVVAHSGPMTELQRLWAAVMWGGPGAALAGLTAATV